MEIKLSEQEIHKFLEIIGPVKGKKVLEVLERVIPGVQAIYATDIGRELVKDDLDTFLALKEKIENVEATPEEEAEYLFLKNKRLPKVVGKLRTYLNTVGKIKAAGER